MHLEVSISDAIIAQFRAPASWAVKRAFFRFSEIGRTGRSYHCREGALPSISLLSPVRNRKRPSQYLAVYLRASPGGEAGTVCQASNLSRMGFDQACQATILGDQACQATILGNGPY